MWSDLQEAPYTVRQSVEKTDQSDPAVTADEQEKRTEAASKVLKSSAGKQRSYVFSAAKKYDSTSENPESSPPKSFVAKRVVISDDEDNLPPLKESLEMSVDEPAASVKKSVSSKTQVKPQPAPKQSIYEPIAAATIVAPVATLKQTSTTPDTTPKPSATIPVAPPLPTAKEVPPTAPVIKPKPEATPKPSVKPKPEENSRLNDDDLLGLNESTSQKSVDPVPSGSDLIETGSFLPKGKKTKASLDLLAVDVIPIDTSTDKLISGRRTTTVETTKTVVQTKKEVKSSSSSLVKTGTSQDLLTFDDNPTQNNKDKTQSKMETTKTTWTTETKSSLPSSKKTSTSRDLLAFDAIPIDTNTDKLSQDKKRSTTETTTTTRVTTKKSSADPFDPIPAAAETTKSPVELFDPLLSDSKKDQQSTVSVTFEQKSSTSSSPWSKWAIPTMDTEESEPAVPDPQPLDTTYTYTSKTVYSNNSPPEPEFDSRKSVVYVKSYVNMSEPPSYSSSRYNNSSDFDFVTSSTSSYAYSSPPSAEVMSNCTYCGKLVGSDSKITIDHLNISCHPECFKCGICSKPMGDFIHSMFLHRGTVHCESCYENVF
ncbi:zinc finger protein 185 [Trichomycterus rosablanca]|uniref:zinc finger protein 185 n=1 Tax=Trichomycterus rosablanca TaxID=2290929 RepID=UPI002F35F5A1